MKRLHPSSDCDASDPGDPDSRSFPPLEQCSKASRWKGPAGEAGPASVPRRDSEQSSGSVYEYLSARDEGCPGVLLDDGAGGGKAGQEDDHEPLDAGPATPPSPSPHGDMTESFRLAGAIMSRLSSLQSRYDERSDVVDPDSPGVWGERVPAAPAGGYSFDGPGRGGVYRAMGTTKEWWNVPGGVAAATGSRYTSLAQFAGLREVGAGCSSRVYAGTCRETGQVLAVKVIPPDVLLSEQGPHAMREIRIMARLGREVPMVTGFHGAFECDDGRLALVQEWAPGGDLYALLKRCGGRLAEDTVARRVVGPLLVALAGLHSRGVIHRDIKPENVLFSARGEVRLADFGLAVDTAEQAPEERLGTLDYMAPEVLARPLAQPGSLPPYDDRVDVWAVGVLAYEILVDGRPPFEVESEELTCAMILWAEMPRLPPHLSPECQDFLRKALCKDAGRRPPARDLLWHPWIVKHQPPRGRLS